MKSVFLALLAFVLIAFPTSALAGGKPKAPPPPPDMRKLVKSVDAKNNSVSIIYQHSKLVHIYRMDVTTAIKIDNIAGKKITDIKPGMEVTSYLERDNDDLDSVTLSTSTSAPVNPTP